MGESWRNSTGCSPRTCLPSIAPLISLKVEVNSPMKSCLPLESQSHTMHCNRKEVVFFLKLKNVSTAAEDNENFLGQKSKIAACGMMYAFGFHWLYLAFLP